MDKAVKFFIENYPNVKAVLDLNDYVQEKLPHVMLKLLYGALDAKFKSWDWGTQDSIDHINSMKDDDELYWSDKRWLNKKGEMGIYFGVSDITSSSLLEPEDDDRPFLYLYHDKDVGNLTLEALIRAINNARPQLKQFGDIFNHRDGRGCVLVGQYIDEIANIESLKYQDEMLQKFIVKAREFTEALIRSPNARPIACGEFC